MTKSPIHITTTRPGFFKTRRARLKELLRGYSTRRDINGVLVLDLADLLPGVSPGAWVPVEEYLEGYLLEGVWGGNRG